MTHSMAAALLAGAMVFAQVSTASAHHSYTSFDPKFITLTGTVKDYQYTSPHIWTELLVTGPDGKVTEWGMETGSPASMKPMGWSARLIHVGDKITTVMHPKRDGSKAGSVVEIDLPGGRVIKAGDLVAGPGKALSELSKPGGPAAPH